MQREGNNTGRCATKWLKLSDRPGDVYRVVLGEHDMNQQEGTEQIRDILRIIVHPNWDIDHVADGWVYSVSIQVQYVD